jgi:hypothetical protein
MFAVVSGILFILISWVRTIPFNALWSSFHTIFLIPQHEVLDIVLYVYGTNIGNEANIGNVTSAYFMKASVYVVETLVSDLFLVSPSTHFLSISIILIMS